MKVILYKVTMCGEVNVLGLAFAEIDSQWHFINFGKENVEWRGYKTKEIAQEKLKEKMRIGIISSYEEVNLEQLTVLVSKAG